MNTHISIIKLLQKFRDSNRFDLLNTAVISTVNESITYIQPELEIKVENVSKPFVIISAPGAVGKTTFARYAACTRKGYYWDLSTLQLGSNTFSGALLDAFGAKEISKVLDAISKGEMTLFIDSLDEAEIVSGWAGIEKFLEEIVKFARNSPQPNIIIFSRAETALEIQMKLDDIGGKDSYSVYQIDYFSEDKAIAFIENRINQKGASNHSSFREPFLLVVKSIFKAIGMGINDKVTNLWDDDEIRCFLGYSPVLQTIGDFLFNQNYAEINKQFQTKQNVESGLEIISNFIAEILKRDSEKFIKGLKEKTIAAPKNWNGWGMIYTPEDQTRFVLNCIAKRDIKDNMVFEIPSWLEKGFFDSLKYFLQNHPFIKDSKFSSPAFRDFVLAKSILVPNFENTCIELLNSGNFVLTPLFSFFYKKFSKGICKATHAGLIYESVSSRINFDGNSLLTCVKQSDKKTVFEIINSSGAKTNNILMECVISNQIPLTFLTRLNNASIEVDSDVVLGRKNGSFEVQNVEIIAKKIQISAKHFIANCHDENNSVLVADEFIYDPTLEITHKGNGELIVNGKGTRSFPWASYYKEYDPSSVEDYKEELYLLKRILEPFRKHGRDEFAKQYEFIDNEIIKNIPERKKLLNYMIELEIIRKGGSEDKKYFMSGSRSIQYGISWSGLKTLECNDTLKAFLSAFKKKYPR